MERQLCSSLNHASTKYPSGHLAVEKRPEIPRTGEIQEGCSQKLPVFGDDGVRISLRIGVTETANERWMSGLRLIAEIPR